MGVNPSLYLDLFERQIMKKIFFVVLLISTAILLFLCSDPIKPDFADKPEISENGSIQTFGTLDCDSTFGLYVVISGTDPFTFNWFKNDSLDTSATTDTLLFPALTFSDSGKYFCIVTNKGGSDTSTVYTLIPVDTMPKPPLIADSGKVNIFGKLQIDSSFGMYISATGTEPIVYEWYKNGTILPNASDDTLNLIPLSPEDSGFYSCLVSNIVGYDTSNICTVSVLIPPYNISLETPGVPEKDSSFFIHVKASGSDTLLYQWYKDSTALASETKDTLAFPKLTEANNNTAYYCIVSNAAGATASETYTLILGNHPPQWLMDTLHCTVNEDDTLKISLLDSCFDPDNDTLTFSIQSDVPPDGDSIIADIIYFFAPNFTQAGTYSLKITASDGNISTGATMSLTVNNVNRAPVFVTDSPALVYDIEEAAALQAPFKAVDPDGDKITYTLKKNGLPRPATVVFDTTKKILSWQSQYADSGKYDIVLSAFDAFDTTDIQIAVYVGFIAIPPQITVSGLAQSGLTVQIPEMQTYICTVSVIHPDSNSVSFLPVKNAPYTITGMGTGGFNSISKVAGIFSYTPSYTVSTPDSIKTFFDITFSALTNQSQLKDSFVVNITVTDINRKPVFNEPTTNPTEITLNENSSQSVNILIIDPDGTIPTLDTPTLPSWVTITDNGSNSYTLKAAPDYSVSSNTSPEEKDTLIFKAVDENDQNLLNTHTFNLTVNNINRNPVFDTVPVDTTLGVGKIFSFTVSASDIDGDVVSLSLENAPNGISYSIPDKKIICNIDRETFIPTSTPYSITLKGDDGYGGTCEKTWKVGIKAHEWELIDSAISDVGINIAAKDSLTLFAATFFGISWTKDAGKNWTMFFQGTSSSAPYGLTIIGNYIYEEFTAPVRPFIGSIMKIDLTSAVLDTSITHSYSYSDFSFSLNGNRHYNIGAKPEGSGPNTIYNHGYVHNGITETRLDTFELLEIESAKNSAVAFTYFNDAGYKEFFRYSNEKWDTITTLINSIFFYDSSDLEIASENGDVIYISSPGKYQIHKITNATASQIVIDTKILTCKPTKILLLNDHSGWIISAEGKLFYTNDSFQNVTEEVIPGGKEILYIIKAADEFSIFAYNDNELYRY